MVDLENNNLNISLLAEENISSSLISENLQVIFDTSTNISVKPALSYIKSGQKEISDYVSNVAEPRLSEYVQTAENQMQNCVNAVQKFADDIVDKGFVKTADFQNALEGKQDVISDLPAIRNGAMLGATAVQPSALNGYATENWVSAQGYITSSALVPYALSADLASVATSGSYNDLSNKPDLSAKANIDLSNCTKPYIVETYVNGTSWYRVYSDGWCEQGANNQTSDTNGGYTVTFLKPFKNTNYNVTGMTVDCAGGTQCVKYTRKSAASISFWTTNNTTYSSMQFNWQACGYIS